MEPIFLPVGNDGVRVKGYFKTFWEHYQQARRHCWGAGDIPYAIRQFFAHPEIPLLRRVCGAPGASSRTTCSGRASGSSSPSGASPSGR